MLFNSLAFAVFLPLVFLLYWYVFQKSLKWQNFFLLIVSYIFYGWWNWRFLSLIAFSTVVDYSLALLIKDSSSIKNRKAYLLISLLVNLGLLGFFKYYNFFIDSLVDAFHLIGINLSQQSLSIVLPIGISFYTFQTLSYTIDVYRKNLEPTKDFISFASYVSFFPQLVAGPIERASHLLPQFYKNRKFNLGEAADGMRQILWGFFKKMVIADNCAPIVNEIFGNYTEASGSTLMYGAILFSIQIYGDFSGYSDIAIGVGRLFGFDFKKNFAFPHFSRDIAEFWRRWHISLSTWFRDYLYIPLGGSLGGTKMKVRNTFIIFIVSGLWHGANWTFIFWGFLHAVFFLPLLLSHKHRVNTDIVAENTVLPSAKELFQMLYTFMLVTLALVIFRSITLSDSFHYLSSIFSKSLFTSPQYFNLKLVLLLVFFYMVEWVNRREVFGLDIQRWSLTARWSMYFLVAILWLYFANFNNNEFIYFQF